MKKLVLLVAVFSAVSVCAMDVGEINVKGAATFNGTVTGLTVSNGGTGATTASGARTNLGLGTAATTDASAYATASQGSNADAAYAAAVTNATNANTASTIVKRDASGNFSAGTITAALSGNATTATTATTAGNVSGTVAVANGGTGATTASGARTNLSAATLVSGATSGNLASLTSSGDLADAGIAAAAVVKKMSASKTVYIGTSGKTTKYLDNAAAVDLGSGKVGLPCTGHPFASGDSIHVLYGTAAVYNGVSYTVDAATTANQIVISCTYAAETFASNTVLIYYNQSVTASQAQTLISAELKNLNICYLLFQFYDGRYVFSAGLSVLGFYNGQYVSIKGNASDSTLSLKKAVRIECSSYPVIEAKFNTCPITIAYLDCVNTVATVAYGLTITNNSGVTKITCCNFKYTALASGSMGIYADTNINVIVYRCYIGGYIYGIGVYNGDGFISNCVEWSSTYKPTYSIYASTSFVKITTTKPASTSGLYEDNGAKILDYTP